MTWGFMFWHLQSVSLGFLLQHLEVDAHAQPAICLMGSAVLKAEVSEGLSLLEGFRLMSECANRMRSGSDSTARIGVGRQIVSGW